MIEVRTWMNLFGDFHAVKIWYRIRVKVWVSVHEIKTKAFQLKFELEFQLRFVSEFTNSDSSVIKFETQCRIHCCFSNTAVSVASPFSQSRCSFKFNYRPSISAFYAVSSHWKMTKQHDNNKFGSITSKLVYELALLLNVQIFTTRMTNLSHLNHDDCLPFVLIKLENKHAKQIFTLAKPKNTTVAIFLGSFYWF